MTRNLKSLPKFANETDERAYWEVHNSRDYVDRNLVDRARLKRIGPRLDMADLRDQLLAGRNSLPGPTADNAYFEHLRSRARRKTAL